MAEYIMAGELVIEYCGEIVRRPIADARERTYAAAGAGGSCYMFALDAVRPTVLSCSFLKWSLLCCAILLPPHVMAGRPRP